MYIRYNDIASLMKNQKRLGLDNLLEYSPSKWKRYLEWVQNQTDSIFRLKYEQCFLYLQAIINFRTGVRFNRSSLRLAARGTFAPIWSAR